MRGLARNKTTVYYALYTGDTENTVDGLYTGETIPSYGTPQELGANVSAARGTSEIDLFGINVSYTKTIVVDDTDCPIDEHSILWIGIEATSPHNYEVVGVAKSLNHITYAVQEVNYA